MPPPKVRHHVVPGGLSCVAPRMAPSPPGAGGQVGWALSPPCFSCCRIPPGLCRTSLPRATGRTGLLPWLCWNVLFALCFGRPWQERSGASIPAFKVAKGVGKGCVRCDAAVERTPNLLYSSGENPKLPVQLWGESQTPCAAIGRIPKSRCHRAGEQRQRGPEGGGTVPSHCWQGCGPAQPSPSC